MKIKVIGKAHLEGVGKRTGKEYNPQKGARRVKIYHCNIKVISRGKGKSAVAAAAYRAGEKITNHRPETG